MFHGGTENKKKTGNVAEVTQIPARGFTVYAKWKYKENGENRESDH
jgi:hypothetical protein